MKLIVAKSEKKNLMFREAVKKYDPWFNNTQNENLST